MSICTSDVPLMSCLLETVSSRGQDIEALTKMRRQKQQNPDRSAPTLPGFHRRINGDSMTIKHVIYQVPTPARTGGGGCDGTGFEA